MYRIQVGNEDGPNEIALINCAHVEKASYFLVREVYKPDSMMQELVNLHLSTVWMMFLPFSSSLSFIIPHYQFLNYNIKVTLLSNLVFSLFDISISLTVKTT